MCSILHSKLKIERDGIKSLWSTQLAAYKRMYNLAERDIVYVDISNFNYSNSYAEVRHCVLTCKVDGELVILGIFHNSKSYMPYELSLIKDERIKNILKLDSNWYDLGLSIQTAIDNGFKVGDISSLAYDPEMIHNIKFIEDLSDANYSYIKDMEGYVLLEEDSVNVGVSKPDVLRNWVITSIPEIVMIRGRVVKLRSDCLKRVNDEAPFFCFTNCLKYAMLHLDFNDPICALWVSYVLAGYMFSVDGRRVTNHHSLLSHKMFEVTFSYLRSKLKFRCGPGGDAALAEGARFLIPDPLIKAYEVKTPFGDLNQYAFARSRGPYASYSVSKISMTNFKLECGDNERYSNRVNYIDDTIVKDAYDLLVRLGLPLNAKLQLGMLDEKMTKLNFKLGKINRVILGMIGYSGTHAQTAIVTQFYGTRDMGKSTSKEFLDAVSNYTERFIDAGVNKYPLVPPDPLLNRRLDVLFKGGTSSASSTFNHKKMFSEISYASPFHKEHDPLKRVFKLSETMPHLFKVVTDIRVTFKTKTATIITNPEDFIEFRGVDLSRRINAGSRLVRGTRAKRIITPTYGSIYATALLTVLPAVKLLSYKPIGASALSLVGSVGTSYEGAMAHSVIAPMLAALCNDPSYFVVAVDFTQFDSSQFGDISAAHAKGLLNYSKRFDDGSSLPKDELETVNILSASAKSLFEIQAKAFDTPMLYKSSGVTAYADGVKSGELSTQLRNTFTNKPHTDMMIDRYNITSNTRKVDLVHENIIGDDKYIVLRMRDGNPLDLGSCKSIINTAALIAEENHMKISVKRSVVGNNVAEHIKLYSAGGWLIQDVFLDSFTSEKNTFGKLTYAERLTVLYDIYMTMLIRFADVEHIMPLFTLDLAAMAGIKSGDAVFTPNISVIAAVGGPEILMGAPEIRGLGRYAFQDFYGCPASDRSWYKGICQLYNTLISGGGRQIFNRIMKRKLQEDETLVSPIWIEHFKRKRSELQRASKRKGLKQVYNHAPENSPDILTDILISTIDEPVINFIDNDRVLQMILFDDLKSSITPLYTYHGWFILQRESRRLPPSPYISADEGVKNVHAVIGLADINSYIVDSSSVIEMLLKKHPGDYPSYLTGNSLLGILSAVDVGHWSEALQVLDFSTELSSLVCDKAAGLIHRYNIEKVKFSGSLYDNTSRTYDLSDESLELRIKTAHGLSHQAAMSIRMEGMKLVLFMARFGFSIQGNYVSDIESMSLRINDS